MLHDDITMTRVTCPRIFEPRLSCSLLGPSHLGVSGACQGNTHKSCAFTGDMASGYEPWGLPALEYPGFLKVSERV